jgi:hypothetical protein
LGDDRTSLPSGERLDRVEAEAREFARCTAGASSVDRSKGVRGILYQHCSRREGHRFERFHRGDLTAIVDGQDRPRAIGDPGLD